MTGVEVLMMTEVEVLMMTGELLWMMRESPLDDRDGSAQYGRDERTLDSRDREARNNRSG